MFVSVGGGAGGGSGGDAGAEGGGVAVVTKPIYKAVPVAYPVPVPVEVPVAVPVEKPVYQKPVYVASKPGGGGQAQGEGAVYGTVNFNAGNLFDNIFNVSRYCGWRAAGEAEAQRRAARPAGGQAGPGAA